MYPAVENQFWALNSRKPSEPAGRNYHVRGPMMRPSGSTRCMCVVPFNMCRRGRNGSTAGLLALWPPASLWLEATPTMPTNRSGGSERWRKKFSIRQRAERYLSFVLARAMGGHGSRSGQTLQAAVSVPGGRWGITSVARRWAPRNARGGARDACRARLA